MLERQTARRLPPYVFAEITRMKEQAIAAGQDVIDLGMGNPDLDPPAFIIDKLCETARRPGAHRYSASAGIRELREAQARYYARRFGVKLDPETEVVATLGAKEGFATLAHAITSPGDAALVPSPCYPIHAFGFVLSGGTPRPIPTRPDENLFRAAEQAIRDEGPTPIAMVLNYPGNPTCDVASRDFYRDAVAFAKKHEILVLSDLAYAEIYFEGEPPSSILEVPGAKDIAVEFTSMSKTFSMPGWRMGFAVGNEKIIAALTQMKSYLDYGAFAPIQTAAIAALDNSEACAEEVRTVYRRRRGLMVETFREAGFDVPLPAASMFLWAPVPEGYGDSMAFTRELLAETGVAVSPGIGFGEGGEGHVRMAMIEKDERIRDAARALRSFFDRSGQEARFASAGT